MGHVYELENCGQQCICHNDRPYGNYKKLYCGCLKFRKADTRRKKFLTHNYYLCDIHFKNDKQANIWVRIILTF